MDKPVRRRRFVNRMARIVLKTVLLLILFVLILLLLIQTPPVQNLIRNKTVAWLEKKLQTKVSVGKIYISLAEEIILKNVYIEDQQKDTLLAGGSLSANINLFRLIFNGAMDFKKIELNNVTLKATRQLPDTIFNYQFVINAFNPPDSGVVTHKDTASFFITIPSVVLNKTRLIYKDVITGSDVEAWVNHLDASINKFDPNNLVIDVPRTNIDGLTARIYQQKPLATPEPLSKDIAEAESPVKMLLNFKEINLKNINLNYGNDVSAFYTNLDLGKLNVTPRDIDI